MQSASDTLPGPDALPSIRELPNPFIMNDGTEVSTVAQWRKRREEIIKLILDYEYGHMPPKPDNMEIEAVSTETILDGAVVQKRVILKMGPGQKIRVNAGAIIPAKGGPKFPVVLSIDPVWSDKLAPSAASIVARGYIFAGFDKQDVDPDKADRGDGVHPHYPGYDWATLSAWAWGFMRTMDWLETLEAVDREHVAVTGHSRGGKTALLAGALDERFALVAPHCSGTGGSGACRIMGKGSETLGAITSPMRFQYWFQPKFGEFSGREDRLPFDQHWVKALVAPRALLAQEARDDHWANPIGSQQTNIAAKPVFDFLGAGDRIGYFIRDGGHSVPVEDWETLIEFADRVFFGKPTRQDFSRLEFPDAPKPYSWKPSAPAVK
ncbi:MAG TPA: hypothetical protein PL033_07960 [Candidatus Brocadiia bacterium]|nr:hypothetical protein [Candidatus Brocadiia bacterium]